MPLALLVGVAVAWHFSDQVLVPNHSGWSEDIEVLGLAPGRIELELTEETGRPGVTGIVWRGGHAVIGPALSKDDDSVTRRLSDVEGYLVEGLEVSLDTSTYAGNPRQARGLPFLTVPVEGELGRMPAWFVPGSGEALGGKYRIGSLGGPHRGQAGTWAIFVHGINDDPEVGNRVSPLFRRLGIPSLSITYREDLGAPESPDGYHHMGLTEWRDLESAARYALAHGARRLILFGWSMGGSLVTQFMQGSDLSGRVSGLILDAPALNWERILEFHATEMGLPAFTSLPVRWAIGARIDADWERLDALGHTDDLELPILLFHGAEDDNVPVATSEELAEALPAWVTFHKVPEAGHTESWNVGPGRYEAQVRAFLEQALGMTVAVTPETQRARPKSGSK